MLRKTQQEESQGRQPRERGIQPRVNGPDQYVIRIDNQPQEPSFQPPPIKGQNSKPSLQPSFSSSRQPNQSQLTTTINDCDILDAQIINSIPIDNSIQLQTNLNNH